MKLQNLLHTGVTLLLMAGAPFTVFAQESGKSTCRIKAIRIEDGKTVQFDTVLSAAPSREDINLLLKARGFDAPPAGKGMHLEHFHDSLIRLAPGDEHMISNTMNMRFISDSIVTTIMKTVKDGGDTAITREMRVIRLDTTMSLEGMPDMPHMVNGQVMIMHGDSVMLRRPFSGKAFKVLIMDIDEKDAPATGVSSKENSRLDDGALNMYPNPNSGKFTVDLDLPGKQDATLNITDAQGRMVYTKQITRPRGKVQEQVDLQGIAPGVYFVTVEQGDKSLVKKVSIW